jgi:hypothetical protein
MRHFLLCYVLSLAALGATCVHGIHTTLTTAHAAEAYDADWGDAEYREHCLDGLQPDEDESLCDVEA